MSSNGVLNANLSDVSLGDFIGAMNAINGDKATDTAEVKLTDATKSWENSLMVDDKESTTIRNYLGAIRHFFDWGSFKNVSDIDASHVTSYRDYMQNIKKRKPTTVNNKLIGLSLFFEFCVESGYCSLNPAKKVKKVRHKQIRAKAVDESTLNRLRNFIKLNCEKRSSNFNHLMIFDFLRGLGLRITECVDLRFEDVEIIDASKGLVTIRQGKGNRYRQIPMPTELIESFIKFKSSLNRRNNDGDFIFKHHGKQYTDSAIRTYYRRMCQQHDIEHINPHRLRHSYITTKANNGAPLTHIQILAGHANVNTTARYATPSVDDLFDTVNKY